MCRCACASRRFHEPPSRRQPDTARRRRQRVIRRSGWGGVSLDGSLTTETLPANRGFGTAANVGVRLAANEAVVLLNPDTWLVDDSLHALAEAALRLGAVVGPRVLDPSGEPQPSASASPVGAWPWVRAVVPVGRLPRAVVANTEPWRLSRSTRVVWLTGACIAAPRSTLLELGPFDESFEMYGEDMDLGLRAQSAGVASYFLPDVARVVHVGNASSDQRYDDGGTALTALRTVEVIRRHYGRRRARLALAAERLRTRTRLCGKRLLRRPAEREAVWLAALSQARLGRGDG